MKGAARCSKEDYVEGGEGLRKSATKLSHATWSEEIMWKEQGQEKKPP
jgi:hypothetical protein